LEKIAGFDFIINYKYFGVFAIVFLYSTGFASIIPGRSVIILLGVLCSNGNLVLCNTILTAIFTSIIGANVGYFVGKYTLGNIIARKDRLLFISKKHIDQALFIGKKHGAKLIIPAMFIGGFWLLTSVIPGMVHMKYTKFALFNNIGLVLWVNVLTMLGYFGGYAWSNNVIGKSYIIIIALLLIIMLLLVRRRLIRV